MTSVGRLGSRGGDGIRLRQLFNENRVAAMLDAMLCRRTFLASARSLLRTVSLDRSLVRAKRLVVETVAMSLGQEFRLCRFWRNILDDHWEHMVKKGGTKDTHGFGGRSERSAQFSESGLVAHHAVSRVHEIDENSTAKVSKSLGRRVVDKVEDRLTGNLVDLIAESRRNACKAHVNLKHRHGVENAKKHNVEKRKSATRPVSNSLIERDRTGNSSASRSRDRKAKVDTRKRVLIRHCC